jgi:hypothetical protein
VELPAFQPSQEAASPREADTNAEPPD